MSRQIVLMIPSVKLIQGMRLSRMPHHLSMVMDMPQAESQRYIFNINLCHNIFLPPLGLISNQGGDFFNRNSLL
jgi:hypothetical protein